MATLVSRMPSAFKENIPTRQNASTASVYSMGKYFDFSQPAIQAAKLNDGIKLNTTTPNGSPIVLRARIENNIERSPCESPIAVKKKLKRLASSPTQDSQDLCKEIARECAKTVLEGLSPKSKSILKPRSHYSTSGNRLQFSPSVQVREFDENGDTVCDKCADLLTIDGPRSPRYEMMRRPRRPGFGIQLQNSDFAQSDYLSKPKELPTRNDNTPSYQTNANNEQKKLNITFLPDSKCGTKLKFVVSLGCHYDTKDLVVKACSDGTKIRVQASKTLPSGTILSQFHEHYSLPMPVDPYAVEAKLDSKGFLTVEAPLLTNDKKLPTKIRSESHV